RAVARFDKTPSVSTRLLPVNNSEPAKTTMVSAPPKQTPIANRTTPGEPVDNVPPMVKISTIAAPTYMPASMERTKWLINDPFWPASLAAACSLRVVMASLYMQFPVRRTTESTDHPRGGGGMKTHRGKRPDSARRVGGVRS